MDENLQEMAFNVFLAMICGERSNPKIGDVMPSSSYDQLANDALSAAESFQKAVAKRAKARLAHFRKQASEARRELITLMATRPEQVLTSNRERD